MSQANLALYYFDECPYCQRVMKVIKDLHLKIEMKNTKTDSANRDFHMKTTGMTQVPCLYIDGKPMFESSDIMNWLKDNEKNLAKSA
ncbi:MAG: glutaredoxin family protein [Bacteriovoracaceae bacterium]